MNLTALTFADKTAAREDPEAQRWPDGVVCPHCGGTKNNGRLEGKTHRPGLFQRGECRREFTVTVGTVFERSAMPLNKWLLATPLMASSKKVIRAHQSHRSPWLTHGTARFMVRRICEALRSDDDAPWRQRRRVERDETSIDPKTDAPMRHACHHRTKLPSVVDRETAHARRVGVDDPKPITIAPILRENIAKEAPRDDRRGRLVRPRWRGIR